MTAGTVAVHWYHSNEGYREWRGHFGSHRLTYQDSCFALVAATPLGEVSLAVVCDGVGGFDHGEVASGSVSARFARWFTDELPDYIKLNKTATAINLSGVKPAWEKLLERCNAMLYQQAAHDGTRWGTTFTGILIHRGMYVLAQVGDSRCYLISSDDVRQLTVDQTFAQRELSLGHLTEEDLPSYPKRNQLLQAVGSQNGLVPEVTVGTFDPESVFVVCSDGLTRTVQPSELRDLFLPVRYAEDTVIADTCETAFRIARSRGEQDDVSVVCVAPDAWAPAVPSLAGGSEDATRYAEGLADLSSVEEGTNSTLAREQTGVRDERTGTFTKSGTEASTLGNLVLDYDDDEATADSFDGGDA